MTLGGPEGEADAPTGGPASVAANITGVQLAPENHTHKPESALGLRECQNPSATRPEPPDSPLPVTNPVNKQARVLWTRAVKTPRVGLEPTT